jgi:hypothetical protein
VWSVAGHDEVQAVLRDYETFTSTAGAGITDLRKEDAWRSPSILLEVDPPVHSVNRRVVGRALAPRKLRLLQEVFDRSADELTKAVASRGHFDAVKDLAEVFPTQVFPDFFGLRGEGRDQLIGYGAMVFNGMGPRNELFDASMAGAERVVSWISEACSRSSLQPDGLGAEIYAAVDAGEVSEEDAALLVRSFLSAGVDTTVNAIALGILAFAQFPDQWERLCADPSLARNAFDEVVRRESPVIGFFRTTTRCTRIGGIDLPADAKVLAFFAGSNRDPRRWANPDGFDIERNVVGHLGYGTGVHNCIGLTIARMEGEALFRALAQRISRWHIAGEVRLRLNNTLRGLDSLPVQVDCA